MYIGIQKIISEKPVENDLIEVKLEANPVDEMGDVETSLFHKDILEFVKTKELDPDLTELRHKKFGLVVGELLLVLSKYNVPINDIKYILTMVDTNIDRLKEIHERELYGDHESKRTLHHFRKEMFNNS